MTAKKLAWWLCILLALVVGLFWLLTSSRELDFSGPDSHSADLANGELLFHAGGCASCHGEALQGGLEMKTDFGTFLVPNISPDLEFGIGGWSGNDFLNAMKFGRAPEGHYYYPAFPYTSYSRASAADLLDLKAYLDSLPASRNPVAGHDTQFPWSIRRGIGLWNLLYLDDGPVVDLPAQDEQLMRGRYLVEALGHCAECHTPRGPFGGLDTSQWLAGGPNPDGDGKVPNITPHEDGIGGWSEQDIAYYLESGFTPDYDVVGGSMAEVQENTARLSDPDRAAIAAYLKAIPALPNEVD